MPIPASALPDLEAESLRRRVAELEGEVARLRQALGTRDTAEEALRGSEERYRLLAELLPHKVWIARPDGFATYYNQRFLEYHGPVGREVEARAAFIHPDDRRQAWPVRDAAMAVGEPFQVDVRLRRHDGAYRWHRMSVVPLKRDGEAVEWIGTAMDIDDMHRAESALRESEERLRLAIEATALGTWDVRPQTGRRQWSDEFKAILGLPPEAPASYDTFAALIHPEDRDWVIARYAEVFEPASGGIYDIEFRILRAGDGVERWVRTTGRVHFDDAGRPVRVIGTLRDVTARKRAEERQRLLLNELNHRVKNTLATVQSLAWQTLRAGGAPDAVRRSFEARLMALSNTHNLLTRGNWEEAPLREILEAELAPYRDAGRARFVLEGEPVGLGPQATLVLGLAFHELATNAAKYGALSVPAGRVEVTWKAATDGAGPRLDLTWRETGGPAVEPPGRKGFGSRLIERGVAHELGGQVQVDFHPDGLCCRLQLPLPDRGR